MTSITYNVRDIYHDQVGNHVIVTQIRCYRMHKCCKNHKSIVNLWYWYTTFSKFCHDVMSYKTSVNLWYWYATFSKFCHDVMSYSVMYNQVGKVNVNYILDPELYVLKDFELVAVSAMEIWFKTCTSNLPFFAMKIWFKTCTSICQIETCAENHIQLKRWKFYSFDEIANFTYWVYCVNILSILEEYTEYIGWIYWVYWAGTCMYYTLNIYGGYLWRQTV